MRLRLSCAVGSLAAISLCTVASAAAILRAAHEPRGVSDVSVLDLEREVSQFDRVLETVAGETADSDRTRGTLLARMAASQFCLPPNLTDEQLAEVFRQWDSLPESVTGGVPLNGIQTRFNLANETFVGNGAIGPSGKAVAASLTFSFPPDVVTWGSGDASNTGPNVLHSTHVGLWGTQTDLGREFIRQGFANYRKWAGLTYTEVLDDGRPYDQATGRRAGVGDVRIGGALVNSTVFVAYNSFPGNGSDMFIDTSYYNAATLNNPANNFRLLRNMIVHEHGHGVGKIHQVPCNNSKLMEPVLTGAFDMLQIDDIRAAQRNFGDRFSGNHSAATATSLGDLTAGPTGRSLRFPLLSTNGTFSPTNPTGADWFRFDTSVNGRPITIRVIPRGGNYTTGQQMAVPMNICAGASAAVNAAQAGNLRLELYFIDPNGAPFFTSSAGGPGVDEVLGFTLGTGPHWIRVADDGPNPSPNQVVQLYDLEILINNQPSEPIAIAGVNKLARVGELCAITPGVNSQATQPGATIASFQYDLDGDGILETSGATGSTTYNTPGIRNVKVRATDSNGKFSEDTITINVLSIDSCAGAQQIYVNTPTAGTTAGATDAGDAPHGCVSTTSDAGVWYRFVPAATARHSVHTCPIAVDTVVSVFSGECGALTSIGCDDDDDFICPGTIRASSLPNLTLTAGVSYYIKVSGFQNAVGTFTLNVTQSAALGRCCSPSGTCVLADQVSCTGAWTNGGVCLPNTCAPTNDPCTAPISLALNTPVLGSTVNVPNSDPDNIYPCAFGQGRGVWFTFTPAVSTRYQVSTCDSSFFTLLNLFTGNCANTSSFACSYTTNPANPVCGNGGAQAVITSVALTAGTPYRVLLSGGAFGGGVFDGGNYKIVVRCFADFNQSGSVTVQDIFDFLAAYFAANIAADADGSGVLGVQDIFDFLAAYFAGCA